MAEPAGRPTGADAATDDIGVGGDALDDGDDDLGAFRTLVARGRARARSEHGRVLGWLEDHADRPVIDIGRRLYERDRDSAGTVVGSAIALRLFLFFIPLVLFGVGLLGFVAVWVEPEDLINGTGIGGGLAGQIQSAFEQPNSTRWVATLAGFFGLMISGRTLSRVSVAASSLAWRLPVRTSASARVIGGVVGLVGTIGLVATFVNRMRDSLGLAVAGASFLLAAAVYVVAWLFILMLMPRATSDPGALLPGAVLIAATLAGMQAVSQLYLPDKLGRASQLYGAIGTSIVTLGWFFILGRAIVIGMALNAVLYERFGSISRFVFGLPLLRQLPRRSARFAEFFNLADPPTADAERVILEP